MKRVPVLVQLAGLSLVTAFAVAGCSGDDGPSIVVYNAQHEQLLEEIAPKFTEKTGIEVELRNGSDPELAAQLIEEGDASPADVFLTENSPAMSAVERAGLFAPLDDATVEPIPAQYRPDERGVDRVRGPLHRPGLQHQHGRRGRPAGLDHGPRRSRSTPG